MKPIRTVRPVITDNEIETAILMREELKIAAEQLERIKEEVAIYEEQLMTNLSRGARVESRFYCLDIGETERRFPPWKEHFISALGKEAADKITAATEPKTYRRLIVKSI